MVKDKAQAAKDKVLVFVVITAIETDLDRIFERAMKRSKPATIQLR